MLRDGQNVIFDTGIGGDTNQVGGLERGITFQATRVGEDLVLVQVDSVSPDRVLITGVFFDTKETANPWIDAVIAALEFLAGSDRPEITILREVR